MRLWAVIAQHEGREWCWTHPSPDRDYHVTTAADALPALRAYAFRVAEFVEVAHAPTDRPPAPVPEDSIHGPGGVGC